MVTGFFYFVYYEPK